MKLHKQTSLALAQCSQLSRSDEIERQALLEPHGFFSSLLFLLLKYSP